MSTLPPSPPPLSLTIALDTLRHLGMNLYSSLPPVLSELVANAYDARARRVDITIKDGTVVLLDDGVGMTRDEVQTKYLVVGRDRRLSDPTPAAESDPFTAWPRREKPMGRKGIGKLAMFSIANTVDIVSARDGTCVAMRMKREDIEESARQNQPYHPEEVPATDPIAAGTRITLSDLRRTRAISSDTVRKAIARRFSVISTQDGGADDTDFSVYVGGSKVTAADWDIFRSLQGVWWIGPVAAKYASQIGKDCVEHSLPNALKLADDTATTVSGWIGTVHKPDQLKSGSGDAEINDNKIVIDARGKVAIANFLHQFGESGNYAAYLAGYIRADFLDDNSDDIATSDRERMREDDPRVEVLKNYVRSLLKTVQANWSEMRRTKALQNALGTSLGPVVSEWIGGLSDDEQHDARTLLGRMATTRFSADVDQAEMLKYGILAFERLRVRKSIHVLRDMSGDQLAAVATMFALESDLENALYADIATQRLAVVRMLQLLVDSNEKERVIQKHIFEHLWLLEPSWTIQDQLGARLEERVTTEFNGVNLSKEATAGRLDVRYRRSGGIHIIVELKRPEVSVTLYELLAQTQRYKAALAQCLSNVEDDTTPNIQCVCLVGKRPNRGLDDEKLLAAAGMKIMTYDEVLDSSSKRFADYLDAQKKFSRIQSILARLDQQSATDD